MYSLFKALALPPFNLIILLVIGLILISRNVRRIGLGLAWASVTLLYIASTDQFGDWLMRGVQTIGPVSDTVLENSGAQAIVLLSATLNPYMVEFGGPKADAHSLVRLRYAAHIHRKTNLPVLISGGQVPRRGIIVAQVLAQEFEEAYGHTTTWIEDRSTNTYENALYSAEMLGEAGITKAILVTEAFHMPRAAAAFKAVGFDVVPAPTGIATGYQTSLKSYLPSIKGLTATYYACHELLGVLWYRLRYY